ncbi:XamI family restriction endonuclease [Bilifractor sp. HCP3S3_D3]|uniref:XamI family restriction endonuclease n=1 Tax=Bilifractor sp. HCP3S3_D3 TaxID=3438907 RepID=UPI003F89C2A3
MNIELDTVFVADTDGETVNIPVDAAIMPLSANAGDIPLLIEAKSAGDFSELLDHSMTD